MASPAFRKGVKQISASYNHSSKALTFQVWLVIVTCCVLAYLDLWRWVWLVLALAALLFVADIGLGIVIALTNLFMIQARRYDTGKTHG